jgi:hypothetical protein
VITYHYEEETLALRYRHEGYILNEHGLKGETVFVYLKAFIETDLKVTDFETCPKESNEFL